LRDRLQNYKQAESILDLSKEEENYFAQLVANQTELNKLDLMEASFNSIEKYIIEDKDPELVPPTIFLPASDQSLAKNVSDLYTLQMERNKAKFTGTASSPQIVSIEKELSDKKLNILKYIDNSRVAISSQKVALKKQVDRFEGEN
jgi:hypothetical protein